MRIFLRLFFSYYYKGNARVYRLVPDPERNAAVTGSISHERVNLTAELQSSEKVWLIQAYGFVPEHKGYYKKVLSFLFEFKNKEAGFKKLNSRNLSSDD